MTLRPKRSSPMDCHRAPPLSGSWSPAGAARAVNGAFHLHGPLRVERNAETEKNQNVRGRNIKAPSESYACAIDQPFRTDWFASYLKDYKQRVDIDGHLSTESLFSISVIQGSILGLIVFLSYINDLYSASDLFKLCLQMTLLTWPTVTTYQI